MTGTGCVVMNSTNIQSRVSLGVIALPPPETSFGKWVEGLSGLIKPVGGGREREFGGSG